MDDTTRRDVRDALAAGRKAVDAHVAGRAAHGHDAREESLTEILLERASDRVRYVEFNAHEEASVGADWLWWFVDGIGECFGLLVQAKRLRRTGSRWSIDFGYRSGAESQMANLLRASADLGVAAAYVLYCGDRSFRGDLTCGPRHSAGACNLCDRAGVSVIAGVCARYLSTVSAPGAAPGPGNSDLARRAFEASIPLEDMADPRPTGLLVKDMNLKVASDALTAFLTTPQAGARQIAKQLFNRVSEMRIGMMSQSGLAEAAVAASPIFGDLPTDTGHYGVSYFDSILSGLRPALPPEILQLVDAGGEAPAGYESVAGVVLIEV